MAVAAIEHIVIAPELCHGAPHVAGTRIRVQDIVMFQHNGWNVEQIAARFDGLRLSQIHAALAYYYDHQAESDAAIQQGDALAQQVAGRHMQDLKARPEADNGEDQ